MASPNLFCRENSIGKLSDWECTTVPVTLGQVWLYPWTDYFSVLTYLLAATSRTTQSNMFSDLFTWTKIGSNWQMGLMWSFRSSEAPDTYFSSITASHSQAAKNQNSCTSVLCATSPHHRQECQMPFHNSAWNLIWISRNHPANRRSQH